MIFVTRSSNPYGAYLESKVLCASPLQVIHLAYEGIIEALEDAKKHLAESRIHQRSSAITKAIAILNELDHSLDHKRGGDLSVQLARLYEYMRHRLFEANFRQIEAPLIEVQSLLKTVDEAWKELSSSETVTLSAAVANSPWMSAAEPASRAFAGYTL